MSNNKSIKEYFIGNDPITAKFNHKFSFRKYKAKICTYINCSKQGGYFLKDKDVIVHYTIGQQYEQNMRNMKITYKLDKPITWISRFIKEFEDQMYHYILVTNKKEKISGLIVSGSEILREKITSMVPHLRDKYSKGIGIKVKENSQEVKVQNQITNIRIEQIRKDSNCTIPDKDYIPMVNTSKKVGPYSSSCKLVDMDLYETLKDASLSVEERKRAITKWKQFMNIKWDFNTVNNNINRGCCLKTIGFTLNGCVVTKGGNVSTKASARQVYYSPQSVETFEDDVDFDKLGIDEDIESTQFEQENKIITENKFVKSNIENIEKDLERIKKTGEPEDEINITGNEYYDK